MAVTGRRRYVITRAVTHAVLMVAVVLVFLPILWAVSSSFKPLADIFEFPVRWIPENFTLENYSEGWNAADFPRYFANSVVVSVVATLSVLLISTMAGFSFNKYSFPGKGLLFALVIATLIIPIQVRVIPLYLIVKSFGWINTFWALIVPQMATPIGIFVMIQFIRYIPRSYYDAARIDGASEPRMFAMIVIPLSRAGLAALTIITVSANWNNFFWPLVVINTDRMRTLPLGLATFQGEYYTEYGQFFAVALLVIIPMVAAFLVFQKHFIESVAYSGIKG